MGSQAVMLASWAIVLFAGLHEHADSNRDTVFVTCTRAATAVHALRTQWGYSRIVHDLLKHTRRWLRGVGTEAEGTCLLLGH